jgi:hypothetical protein
LAVLLHGQMVHKHCTETKSTENTAQHRTILHIRHNATHVLGGVVESIRLSLPFRTYEKYGD